MTLRLKLILLSVLAISITVMLAGYMGYRSSHIEIEKLAIDLTKVKARQAFILCGHYYKNGAKPSDELKKEIAAIKIAKDGYIFIVDNDEENKGELVVHPSNVGLNVYEFPHIMRILDEIDNNGKLNSYSNFIRYSQYTKAKNRQNEKKFGYFTYFRPWHWTIIAAGYESDIFASSAEVRKNMIKVIISVSLIVFLLVTLIIRQMFKPIKQLIESTKEVAKGNWDIHLPYQSKNEVGILSHSFNEMVKSLRKNAYMWQEFEVARQMQIRMLPKVCPEVEGIQISAKYIPAIEVGGDFYDFLQFEPKRLGIMIGDVSGHGLSAAMVMTEVMSTVRFGAEETNRTNHTLEMANVRLYKQLPKNMYVTMFYGIIDLQRHKLFFTNAGHPSPLICRNGNVSCIPQVKQGDKFPLGFVKNCTYRRNSFDLRHGDGLVFYTDGILDARNIYNEFYDYQRFYSSVQKYVHQVPHKSIEEIMNDLDVYRGSTELIDDVTLLVMRIE